MRAPPKVASGLIGIIAPASPFSPERFEAGLAALHGLGYQTRVHPQARAKSGYLAGPDALRLSALYDFLEDPSIDVVMAARGGYGVHRLLEGLDLGRLEKSDKPIVGFSDLTALHAACALVGRRSIHGPVVTQLAELPAFDQQRFKEVLAGAAEGLVYTARGPALVEGRARGRLFGGCLSVVVPLLGTSFLPPLDGAILMLEDTGEVPYRVDRMLTHLRLSGVLQKLAGLALGDFIKCDAPREGEPSVLDVLRERTQDLGIPVLAGLPFGHGATNQAILLGSEVELDADQGRLTVLA